MSPSTATSTSTPDTLTVAEVSRELGIVTHGYIYKAILAGVFDAEKDADGCWRVTRESVETYRAKQATRKRPEAANVHTPIDSLLEASRSL